MKKLDNGNRNAQKPNTWHIIWLPFRKHPQNDKDKIFSTFFSGLIALYSCYSPSITKRVGFALVNNNVCKTLTGDVVLYVIFVDSKYTNPWSIYDIESTLDSIRYAINWIEKKAFQDSIPLSIELGYHSTPQGRIPYTSLILTKFLILIIKFQ